MNKEKFLKLLADVCDVKGAPGFEDEVANVIEGYARNYGRVTQDKMRNLYLERAANECSLDDHSTARRLRIQLDAHMDEVAFMVQAILPNGTLKLMPLGGWISSNVPAHRVQVRRPDGSYLLGLTTSKPPHFMTEEERKQALALGDVVVDIGVKTKAEAEALGIEVGEPVVPDSLLTYDENRDLLIGKAFDCRIGCTALVETVKALDGIALDCDVNAVLSTQEEIGGRGAVVAARRLKADLAIVFEGTPADDTFGSPSEQQTVLGKGPMLRHIDCSMVTHPGFQKFALATARQEGIPVQEGVRTGGGTNGGLIHVSADGIPSIVIGVPVRYIHTSFGIAKRADLAAAIELAKAILQKLDAETYKQITSLSGY